MSTPAANKEALEREKMWNRLKACADKHRDDILADKKERRKEIAKKQKKAKADAFQRRYATPIGNCKAKLSSAKRNCKLKGRRWRLTDEEAIQQR
jgi:hypothetical protein